jgi:hypothetical protein
MTCGNILRATFAILVLAVYSNAQGRPEECSCPQVVPASGTSTGLLTIHDHGTSSGLVVCGSLKKRESELSVIAAEFSIYPCHSDKAVLEFGALQKAMIVSQKGPLRITELSCWPFGPDWKWVDVPLREIVIRVGTPPQVSQKIVLTEPKLTTARIRQVMSDFRTFREARGSTEQELANLIGHLLAAALTGDSEAVDAFRQMRKLLDSLDPFNAESVELYDDASRVLATRRQIRNSAPAHPFR